ncbi:TAXI family TRAP transporter solute-binding subunit [Mesobaculum littorinae]|uniref:TAXI family TRAP transporter solute-binding subunit n=1 Tax=Mesobaculum littorinae TaxID=2486419 RepID=A0A438AKT8_9RHOB|nr:TAXI family TRAP transporter solute-binding subunit [Mesobaculum littorinae]RVV99328.1 TAXI family TRAP transporter solute-binding subunit [Mesobaculum littorinae]
MTRLGIACAALMTLGTGTFGTGAVAQDLSIATGGTGGTYYPYGGGLAELIGSYVDGAQATAEVTGASVENMALIAREETDLAIALADTVYGAAMGEIDPFTDRPVEAARAIASIYPNAVQIVTLADSGIESLQDLVGKRVSVGAPGSGTEVNAEQVLTSNGITYDDIDEQRLNFNETADALRDGDIDAGFWSVGPPTSSILNLAASRDIRMIPLSEDEIAAASEVQPVFAPYTLGAGLYEGVDEDVPTISIPNVLVANAAMDEELAYQITKAMFEHTDELIAVHPAANDTTVEFSLSSTPIPFHPGAIRYYEEIGETVPDDLRP